MISSDQLLKEIERQIALAKQAQSEQVKREAVSAVRALCNVMLSDSPAAIMPSAPQTIQQPVASLNEQPLQEADANGESLFDF
ncbi:YwdI family protein [Sporosarcina cascadiensis]|uniref:YwdI family protein n=1 Tax=Sporosarcina cascadiensis TaxID=2660747 RepID=UPI00129BEDDB|nr:YwdI family protein [Sporosarcina cascadiensis]